MLKINTMKLFLVGMFWFTAAFTWLWTKPGDNHETLEQALLASAIILVSSIAVYALGARIPLRSSAATDAGGGAKHTLFWASLAVSFVGVASFVAFVQTTASIELLKNALGIGEPPTLTDIELRLSTGLMPMWAQILFEVARRFTLPLCAIMFFVLNVFERRNWLVGASIVLLSAICIFGTLDRGVPLLFIALLYGAHFFAHRPNPITDKWLYVSIVAAFVIVGGFKTVQYGEVRTMPVLRNPLIAAYMGENAVAVANPAFQAGAVPRLDDTVHGPIDYAKYLLLSLSDRVALSPVVMTLYAFDQYDEANFLHWSSNRIFSLLGIGHYVTPFESGTHTTYHDAFPVTFLGDVWRNGGLFYMPFFGAFLGLLLLGIDRSYFQCENDMSPIWKAFCALGVVYLFYGNAFNATTLLLIGGSFGCSLFLWFFAKAHSKHAAIQRR